MTVVQILYSGLGGHSSVGFSLIEADTDRDYNHILIFYGIEEMPQSSIDKCNELGIVYFFVKKKKGFDYSSQVNIVSILKKNAPDIILLHSVNLIIPVFYYRLQKNTRIISVEHQPNHLKTKLEWVWSYLLMRLSEKVVFLTEVYRIQMKKRLQFFYSGKKVRVINNGINIDFFKPVKPEASYLTDVVKIGMLARLTNTKDHCTLIRAFKLVLEYNNTVHQLELHIAGEGEMKDSLVALTKELAIADVVHFRGMIPEAATVDFLNELDIYVHASLGETMSTSIMQAMACGKAVIASDVMGISNMIKNEDTGLLVPPKNAEALARTILLLTKDRVLAKHLALNAFNFATANFSNKKMWDNYKVIITN